MPMMAVRKRDPPWLLYPFNIPREIYPLVGDYVAHQRGWSGARASAMQRYELIVHSHEVISRNINAK
jgi:hypothetical protein